MLSTNINLERHVAAHLFEVVLNVCFLAKTRRMETLMRTDMMKMMMRTVPRTQGRITSLMSPPSMTSICQHC